MPIVHKSMFCDVFFKWWVVWGEVWEEIVFLKNEYNLEKYEIKNTCRFNVVLKLEFEVKH